MDIDNGDAVPTDDAIAQSARRAFASMANPPAPSWGAVRVRARHLQRLRLGVAGALVLALLLGVTATVAAASGSNRSVHIEGTPTTTTVEDEHTATTPSPSRTTTTTGPAACNSAGNGCAAPDTVRSETPAPGSVPPPPPDSTTTPTIPAPLHPGPTTLAATLDSVDDTALDVGQTTTLRGSVTNIAAEPVATGDYFATIAGCALPNVIIENEGLLEVRVLQPGETMTFAVPFTAGPEDAGTVYCSIGFSTHLPEIAAPSGPGPGVIAITVAVPPPS